MFKRKFVLRNAAGNDGGASGSTQTPQTQTAASTVDVQAEVQKALAAERAAFQKQLKDATGHDSLDALKESQLKEQGKLQELAEAKTKESEGWRTRFEQTQIKAALLAASTQALDPVTVSDLLTGKAKCDEHGNVTIDGKPVADAVAQLLKDKPFLAKPEGGTGSGAPQQTQKPAKTEEAAPLSPQQRLIAARQAGK
jgi:hypothetical protein